MYHTTNGLVRTAIVRDSQADSIARSRCPITWPQPEFLHRTVPARPAESTLCLCQSRLINGNRECILCTNRPARRYQCMEPSVAGNSDEFEELIRRGIEGDAAAVAKLFERYRPRLKRMVQLRLDRRLQGRVDASDVLQDAYLDLAKRIAEYGKQQQIPFFLWLRMLTGQRLYHIHRQHLEAAMRDANLEVSLYRGAMPQATTTSLAEHLIGRVTSVCQRAARAEMQVKLQEILNAMDPIDREVLVLRHFEELSNNEVAQLLGLTKAAASNRYIRALRRLKEVLAAVPGFLPH